VTLFDADGDALVPAALRERPARDLARLHEALENGTPAAYTIGDLIADLALARRCFGSTLEVR
jgi:hypothetical protein